MPDGATPGSPAGIETRPPPTGGKGFPVVHSAIRSAVGLLLLILPSALALGAEPAAPCPIVPTPKVYKDTGRTAELSAAAAIVVGAKAAEPERYAAERLQGLVERRFRLRLPIAVEDKVDAAVRQVILLGQRTTNAWLDKLCTAKGLDLSEKSPGPDGFIIETAEDGGRQALLIGGGGPRGVIYGQDAFFDLLRRDGEKVVFPVVSVRDWPSIAWRGRPSSLLATHLAPGALDAYVRARANFIDIRHAAALYQARSKFHPQDRFAPFGCPPGDIADKPVVKQVVAEAHRRGLFVYGTVSCGVEPKQFAAVLRTAEGLIEIGVDGLWVSFDDPGATQGAETLIAQAIDLARRHGITGRAIAITPPAGSYEKITTPFNQRAAQVPGVADATWFFTRVPCQADADAARQLGLARHPSWWHNWPMLPRGGFLHENEGGFPLRADGKPAYYELPPLSLGWGSPRYEHLRSAPACTDAVIPWGGGAEEYTLAAIHFWAWNPEKHDWALTRRAIHAYVFGPSQAPAAQDFDEALARLKSLFVLPGPAVLPGRTWPPKLQRPEDRAAALKLLDEMAARLTLLEAKAPAATLLDPARLERLFLEPMRATVAYARTMAELDYPDYAFAGFQARVGELIAARQLDAAQQAFAAERDKLLPKLDQVAEALRGLKGIDDYAEFWRARLGGFSLGGTHTPAERTELEKRFGDFARRDYSKALAPLASPPEGKPLAELAPADWLRGPILWNGPWGVGIAAAEGRQALGISHTFWQPSETTYFAEVQGDIAVPRFQGRLMLDAFVGDTACSKRIAGARFAQLWANDRLLWEQDVTEARRGKEWLSIDATDLAKGKDRLAIVFRVVNKRPAERFETVTLLGPVRLRAVAGKE